MATYYTGYDEERFQHAVGQTLHCIICTNVIKDPVMCSQNEHLFCRACITRHLSNYETCPSCMDPLTVDTLSPASRTVTNLLAELMIRCEFFDRGCSKFIELGDLEMHVRECGFAPAVCSNKGCQITVNKRDLLHHETADCELRRVQCHSCNDIRQEMDTMKATLTAVNEKLDRNEKKLDRNKEHLERNEAKFENAKAIMENVIGKVEVVQEQLDKQEVKMRHVQGDIEEMKKSLNEMKTQLERITRQSTDDVHAEQEEMKKGIAEAVDVDREPEIFVFGGWNDYDWPVSSIHILNLSKKTWRRSFCRHGGRVIPVVYQNEIMLVGGTDMTDKDETSCIIKLKPLIKYDNIHLCTTTEDFPAIVPFDVEPYHCWIYNERLIVMGKVRNYVDEASYFLYDNIIEVSLVPPYTGKVLTTESRVEKIGGYGVTFIDDKIVIVGGRKAFKVNSTVLTYDITKDQWKELEPLPYPVCRMAIVKWGNDNFILVGGVDSNQNKLNTVLMYNVTTQKSYMLPNMRYKREDCVAAVVRDTVVVVGGHGENEFYLNTVEGFRFDRYTWEELPPFEGEDISGYAAIAW